jgi:hypothetical protein
VCGSLRSALRALAVQVPLKPEPEPEEPGNATVQQAQAAGVTEEERQRAEQEAALAEMARKAAMREAFERIDSDGASEQSVIHTHTTPAVAGSATAVPTNGSVWYNALIHGSGSVQLALQAAAAHRVRGSVLTLCG